MGDALDDLLAHGQSVWLDNLSRAVLNDGSLLNDIARGVRGLTSNPTIFKAAIADSSDYDEEIKALPACLGIEEAVEAACITDVRRAARAFRGVFADSGGNDGFVSIEVSPRLAYDVDGTVAAAKRLFAAIGEPNVMIKIPATKPGLAAVAAVIAEGIPVNVTLIFSVERYEQVFAAYCGGLERLRAAGLPLSSVRSVASFFVSRVDTAVKSFAGSVGVGEVGVANCALAYQRFQALKDSPRWQELAAVGAAVQRPLWASTSSKDPALHPLHYVRALAWPETVNTVPPKTLTSLLQETVTGATFSPDTVERAHEVLSRLKVAGGDLAAICQQLEDDGVRAFASSWDELCRSVQAKRKVG